MTRSWKFVMTSNLEHCDDKGHGALLLLAVCLSREGVVVVV